MMLCRPILLEGSPGVGKTSIVSALAKESGFAVTRINLSEQTDVSDLFGADLPVEGGGGGCFEWKDGPLLVALKLGHWVILDELNLASQPVLEGLNSAFDHRGELFIPELNKVFDIGSSGTRFFACQNPLAQGGGRKGLPKSFLNRFTQVYCDELSCEDILAILTKRFGKHPKLETYVKLNGEIEANKAKFGHIGGPWEFNLRDLTRFLELTSSNLTDYEAFYLIYMARMRTKVDRELLCQIFNKIFDENQTGEDPFSGEINVGKEWVNFDKFQSRRMFERKNASNLEPPLVDGVFAKTIEKILLGVERGWMVQLVAESGGGKSSLLQCCADLKGKELRLMTLSQATDATDLLGAFEQFNAERLASAKWKILEDKIRKELNSKSSEDICQIFQAIENRSTGDLKSLIGGCEELEEIEKLESSESRGSFTWIDSDLVESIISGHWIVLDNASLASDALLGMVDIS